MYESDYKVYMHERKKVKNSYTRAKIFKKESAHWCIKQVHVGILVMETYMTESQFLDQ